MHKAIRRSSLCILMITLIFIGIFSNSCSSNQATLSIFAAAGTKEPLDDICQHFEERYNIPITINYGGGGEVLSQMIFSRTGDVYIAPEQRFIETAIAEQVIDPDTVVQIAYMIPVIAVKEGNPKNITSLTDLAKPKLTIAICRPETTLLGYYAIQIFEQADLADEIGTNTTAQAARPDSLLTMLIMGQVDAAIIWDFYENQASEYIDVIYFLPYELTGIGMIQAAISKYNNDEKAAKQFLEFLIYDSSETFKDAGYIIDKKEVELYWR